MTQPHSFFACHRWRGVPVSKRPREIILIFVTAEVNALYLRHQHQPSAAPRRFQSKLARGSWHGLSDLSSRNPAIRGTSDSYIHLPCLQYPLIDSLARETSLHLPSTGSPEVRDPSSFPIRTGGPDRPHAPALLISRSRKPHTDNIQYSKARRVRHAVSFRQEIEQNTVISSDILL